MRFGILLSLVALLAAACDREGSSANRGDYPLVVFDTAFLRIASGTDTGRMLVELAETRQQQRVGLMDRTSLAEDAGMLFLFDQPRPESSTFWMFRTRIPLDIAFLDSKGAILHIQPMEPCSSPYFQLCPEYPAGVEYSAALEANRG